MRLPARPLAALLSFSLSLSAAACASGADDGESGDRPPIQVMVVAELDAHPEAARAAQVAAAALNDRGGIGGRRLEVLPCDTHGRAEDARACAEEAVDRDMVATVGCVTEFAADVVPILEDAGISRVGVFPVGGPDFDSAASFPLVGGGPTVVAGLGALLADGGARRVVVVHPDGPSGQGASALVRIGLASRGLDPAGSVAVAEGTTDFAPAVAQVAAAGADGVAVALPPDLAAGFLGAAGAAGLGARLAADRDAAVAAGVDGVLVPSLFRPLGSDAPAARRFVAEVEASDPELPRTDAALNGWLAIQLFAEAAKGLDSVDRHSVSRALDRLRAVDLGGLVPPYSTTEVFRVPGFSRLYNHTVVATEVRGGDVVELSPAFVDPWTSTGPARQD